MGAPLTDVVVHGADVLHPLGRARSLDPDALRSALTFVTTRKAAKGSGTRSIADLTVEATDIDLRLGRVVRLCRVPGGRSEARSDHSWPDRGHSCRPPFVSADAGRS